MTRNKGICIDCGRLIANSKLISNPKSDKKLCANCRKSERKERNKPCIPQINNSMNNVLEKQKKLVRPSKFVKNNLSRDEEEFLKQKYSFDRFKTGSKKCREVISIRNQLNRTIYNKECEKLLNDKKFNENKDIKDSMNKEFLDGLL